MVWIEFAICATMLTVLSYFLCREGVVLSEKTHIEEGVIGMLFLAIATSFPEIVTSATAVFSLGRVGLGYGDIIGSLMVNFMILFGVDIYCGRGRVLPKVSGGNRLTAWGVVLVLAITLAASLIRHSGTGLPEIRGIGLENVLIIAGYLVYINVVHRVAPEDHTPGSPIVTEPIWEIWGKFVSLLVAVMFLGVWMAHVGEKIVAGTGLSQTFTGALFLGVATSLPEIIVSFAALRANSMNMAVGNILGSNLFDICIIPLLDALCARPILGILSRGEVLATTVTFIMACTVCAGIYIKGDTRQRFGWDTGLVFVVGFTGFVLLYLVR